MTNPERDLVVRPERPDDFEAIAEVVETAFGRSNEVRLVELLRASVGYVPDLALVAERAGRVVGHMMLTYVTLRGEEDRDVLELAPVAVAPPLQRCGIGGALTTAGIDEADARGEPLIVVLGHPAYYPRFGFGPAGDCGIEPPSPELAPAFMVLRLSAYEESFRGRVVFPPAFDGT